jgi:hypothetical protein
MSWQAEGLVVPAGGGLVANPALIDSARGGQGVRRRQMGDRGDGSALCC